MNISAWTTAAAPRQNPGVTVGIAETMQRLAAAVRPRRDRRGLLAMGANRPWPV